MFIANRIISDSAVVSSCPSWRSLIVTIVVASPQQNTNKIYPTMNLILEVDMEERHILIFFLFSILIKTFLCQHNFSFLLTFDSVLFRFPHLRLLSGRDNLFLLQNYPSEFLITPDSVGGGTVDERWQMNSGKMHQFIHLSRITSRAGRASRGQTGRTQSYEQQHSPTTPQRANCPGAF